MKFDARLGARYLTWILLLSGLPLACSNDSNSPDGLVETDCGEVRRHTATFIEENIVPIVGNDQPKIDGEIVEHLKDIREMVRACSILGEVPDNATRSPDADIFLRLWSQLVPVLVPLEQVVESDDARLATILANSWGFRESVQDVRATLQLEDGDNSGSNETYQR